MREAHRGYPNSPRLAVRLPDGSVLRFHRSFYIGRDLDCEVQIQDGHASRRHAQVSFARGQWSIRDLQSSNGLFVDGERVESAPIGDGITRAARRGRPGSSRLGPESRVIGAAARATTRNRPTKTASTASRTLLR